jgi:hypothetical protein
MSFHFQRFVLSEQEVAPKKIIQEQGVYYDPWLKSSHSIDHENLTSF